MGKKPQGTQSHQDISNDNPNEQDDLFERQQNSQGNSLIKMAKKTTLRRFITDKLGYPLEKHVYTTSDGYLNTVYRIPGKKGTNPQLGEKNPNRPVAIYQHGFVDCCIGLIASEEDSLGIRLVNAGFDLWLNNSRGNKYSRDHQQIDLDTCSREHFEAYFNFSFDEMGEFDQPALWRYILNHTGCEKITYIGHSQGTSQMFVSMSLFPEFYQQHLQRFIAIAPVVYLNNMTSIFLQKHAREDWMEKAVRTTMGHEVFTLAGAGNFLTKMIQATSPFKKVGDTVVEQMSDSKSQLIDPNANKNYLQFFPAGTSLRCALHLKQLIIDGRFRPFNFGEEENLKKYGTKEPEDYDLSKIKGFKITLVCGQTDLLASSQDYHRVHTEMKQFENEVEFLEFEEGHLGLLTPLDQGVTMRIMQSVIRDWES